VSSRPGWEQMSQQGVTRPTAPVPGTTRHPATQHLDARREVQTTAELRVLVEEALDAHRCLWLTVGAWRVVEDDREEA
jgi:hypothetical protein